MKCPVGHEPIDGARNEFAFRMTRPLRIEAAGLTYHVHSRGNGRMTIFTDGVDHERFLNSLADILPDARVTCFAFCQMSTHYHAVIRTQAANLSHTMRQINGTYAQWWNRRHHHVGHVFQGRFTAHVIESDLYLLEACRYVVNNPVDAGIVQHASEYRWSSYRATAGLEPAPAFLDVATIHRHLGGGDPTLEYARLVDEPPSETFLRLINGRRSVVTSDGVARQFRVAVEQKNGLIAADRRIGRPPLVALLVGDPSRVALGTRIAEAHDRFAYSLSEIAEYLEVGRNWTGKLLKAGRVAIRASHT